MSNLLKHRIEKTNWIRIFWETVFVDFLVRLFKKNVWFVGNGK